MTKMKMKKEGLEDRLGAILGRSWVVLGAVLRSFLVILYWKTWCFVNNEVFEKIRCEEATWADLRSIWGAQTLQNEPGEGPKMR